MGVLLVAYDVSDDTNRVKLANDLLRMGFSRIQRSVYVYRGSYRGLRNRVAEVAARRIDPRTDTVLIMTVPEWSLENALVIGLSYKRDGVVEL
ncbi:MAG: CRISPR-associated endonuclease Cas2 [Desulfurococcales archaeon]|nr:CRISPR-associated endonuclease Cas2 [Desulfurococcales archaeon]